MESILQDVLRQLFPSRTGESQIMCFTDLGLPCGTQWAAYDVEEEQGIGAYGSLIVW